MNRVPMSFENRCQAGSARAGGRARAYSFVELVLESTAIAVGDVTATGAGGKPPITLAVKQSMPPGLPPVLHVDVKAAVLMDAPAFSSGASIALFLCSVSGDKAELIGTGDTGIWPRTAPNWMFTAGHVEPLAVVVRAAAGVLAARDASNVEARVHVLLDRLWPASTLDRIAAIELAAKDDFWDGVPPAGGMDRKRAAQIVGAEALISPPPHDPALAYATLATLPSFPLAIAIPKLLEALDDADPAARDTAYAALQTALVPLGAPSFGYEPRGDAAARAGAIGRARAFWDGKRGAVTKREVPPLLADLASPELLRRRLAGRLLELLSGKHPSYDAAASAPDRTKAAQVFDDWWKAELPTLK